MIETILINAGFILAVIVVSFHEKLAKKRYDILLVGCSVLLMVISLYYKYWKI
jgi:hypothetical protein